DRPVRRWPTIRVGERRIPVRIRSWQPGADPEARTVEAAPHRRWRGGGRSRMSKQIFVVDAFSYGRFRGNPAGVVPLEAGDAPDATWMQEIAAEMRHSETAYLEPRADGSFGLRWFTPAVAVDLYGHATTASAPVPH